MPSDFIFNQTLEAIKAMPEYLEIGNDEQKYYELVDIVLEEWEDTGQLPDDYDTEGLRNKLRMEWRDIEQEQP
ncbi:hypothetical protein KKD19_03645 [Patescibacteria group bacterium]|nr:hypothetical protein [Patescibacteria group bacterium]MBU4512306.1 hypothetical protein [Patescibacteria group bacterium]MCG2692757.1 hypothetical protein [Candidatus Parcubacteria bacterium]